MQSIAELKTSILQYLAVTDDEKILKIIQKDFKQLIAKERKIVAYTSQGKPLTIADYKKDIDEAIKQANRDELIDQDKIEKKS